MLKQTLAISAIAATCLLSGCATIFSGTTQTIHIQAINNATHQTISNARCVLRTVSGQSFVTTQSPGTVNVPRDLGGLTVNCKAPGFFQKTVATGSSFNAWTIGDVLFWPGAIIDVASGAYKKYPSHITVVMTDHPVKNAKKSEIKAK